MATSCSGPFRGRDAWSFYLEAYNRRPRPIRISPILPPPTRRADGPPNKPPDRLGARQGRILLRDPAI
jgi:hypothetical protein